MGPGARHRLHLQDPFAEASYRDREGSAAGRPRGADDVYLSDLN
jgi:hypothetical protein